MLIDNKFEFGDIVYLKTDKEQVERIVVEFLVSQDSVMYRLSAGVHSDIYYDVEISKEKNILVNQ